MYNFEKHIIIAYWLHHSSLPIPTPIYIFCSGDHDSEKDGESKTVSAIKSSIVKEFRIWSDLYP